MRAGSMAIPTSKACALCRGAALTLVTLFACLVYVELREAPGLSLAALSQVEPTLMSCDRSADFGAGDLLWCADPDSPLCLPALPPSAQVELWDRTPVTLASAEESPPRVGVLLNWPRPQPEARPPSRPCSRLERPPRA